MRARIIDVPVEYSHTVPGSDSSGLAAAYAARSGWPSIVVTSLTPP